MLDAPDQPDQPDQPDARDRLEGLRAAVRVREDRPAGGRSEQVLGLAAEVERARVELLVAVAEWDRDQVWALDGALSPVGWLSNRVGITRAAASRLLGEARLLRDHPLTAEALRAGRIGTEHLALLTRATRKRLVLYPAHEEALLDAAARLPAEEFQRVVRYWAHLADDELGRADPADQDDRWYLQAHATFGGAVAVAGLLDPVAGGAFLAALEAEDRPDAGRSRSRRMADHLVALVVRGANARGASSAVNVNVDVVIDADTARGEVPADLTRARCDIDGIGPVPRSALRELVPDATLRRVVMAGSEVLDLGRGVRFATRAQRRALKHRDGGCVVPDCRRPARWCDVQHVLRHVDGGRTDLTNLVLLCRRHHVMVDRNGWRLERDPTGHWHLRAPTPTRDARRDRGPP